VTIRFVLAAAIVSIARAQAQTPAAASKDPQIAGVVREPNGTTISDVEVGIIQGERLQQFVYTAADGKFLLTGVARSVVPLRVRRLGYAIQFLEVDTRLPSSAALEITLKVVPGELEDVTIPAGDGHMREFYERRQTRSSFARFLDEQEIRRLGPTNPSDLFRSVPGIVINTASTGGGNAIRIRGCQPMVWMDGQRVPGAELDEVIKPEEIAAIEFYPSSAGIPAQYLERGNRLCGLILVWTKTQ
jgi:hypothetical protein